MTARLQQIVVYLFYGARVSTVIFRAECASYCGHTLLFTFFLTEHVEAQLVIFRAESTMTSTLVLYL